MLFAMRDNVSRSIGRRGTGCAGPLAAPPWGGAPKSLRGGGV